MQTISSWSGGKDSCFACYKAMQLGYQVKHLLSFITREYKRGCFHGIEAKLLNLQAELIGIPLVLKEVSPDMQKYEAEFKEAVSELQTRGMEMMVFGDIYLADQLNWIERVCNDLKIKPVEPLWGIAPNKVAEEFIDLGFKAMVVSCQESLGKEFIGRSVDKSLLQKLKQKNSCPCGENGEYHTFVIDGPIFKKRIAITKSRKILKDGFWRHWFLDIQEYKVQD